MKYIVCAIRDIKIGSFSQPHFAPTVGLAVRNFSDAVNRVDDNNPLNRHPADFELWKVAVFDDETGMFSQESGLEHLSTGSKVIVN